MSHQSILNYAVSLEKQIVKLKEEKAELVGALEGMVELNNQLTMSMDVDLRHNYDYIKAEQTIAKAKGE